MTLLVEKIDLEELFSKDITCQMLVEGSPCGKPAAYRVLSVCDCGRKTILFICEPHRVLCMTGKVTCLHCGQVRGLTEFL